VQAKRLEEGREVQATYHERPRSPSSLSYASDLLFLMACGSGSLEVVLVVSIWWYWGHYSGR